MTDVTLHMTETRHHRYDEWVAYCRCGWTGSYLRSQAASRTEGDKHLTEENAGRSASELAAPDPEAAARARRLERQTAERGIRNTLRPHYPDQDIPSLSDC